MDGPGNVEGGSRWWDLLLPAVALLGVLYVGFVLVFWLRDDGGREPRRRETVVEDGKYFELRRPDGTRMWCVGDERLNPTVGPFDCDWAGDWIPAAVPIMENQ